MLGLGNAITSGGAVSDLLTMTTNLQLWFKNGAGVAVTGWKDSSGNNNHATQTSEGNQAALSGGGLDFNDDNEHHYDFSAISIAKGTTSTTGGFCIAVVWAVDANTSTLLSEDSNEFFEFKSERELRFSGDKDSGTTSIFYASSGTPFALGEKMVILFNRTAGSSGAFSIYKNGSAVSIDASSGDSTLVDAGENVMGFDIDTFGIKGASTHAFDGDVFELAFWDKSLSAQEISDVNDYLTTIHGL